MDYIRRSLTITVNTFETNFGIDDDVITKAIEHELNDWHDGRHGFAVEMLNRGLAEVVERAMGKILCRPEYTETDKSNLHCHIRGVDLVKVNTDETDD